ncbi:MAG: hypothetical protein QXL17_02430 [Candidatus Thermoplasmatota archaeon]
MPGNSVEDEKFFCRNCGKQLITIDEIANTLCDKCKKSISDLSKDESFFCYICGTKLETMSEIAQGMCPSCKASILRKIDTKH